MLGPRVGQEETYSRYATSSEKMPSNICSRFARAPSTRYRIRESLRAVIAFCALFCREGSKAYQTSGSSRNDVIVFKADSSKSSRIWSSAIPSSMMRSRACSCVDVIFDLQKNLGFAMIFIMVYCEITLYIVQDDYTSSSVPCAGKSVQVTGRP